jgi:hypothetical protein
MVKNLSRGAQLLQEFETIKANSHKSEVVAPNSQQPTRTLEQSDSHAFDKMVAVLN